MEFILILIVKKLILFLVFFVYELVISVIPNKSISGGI